jgi:hypothetical protein
MYMSSNAMLVACIADFESSATMTSVGWGLKVSV